MHGLDGHVSSATKLNHKRHERQTSHVVNSCAHRCTEARVWKAQVSVGTAAVEAHSVLVGSDIAQCDQVVQKLIG